MLVSLEMTGLSRKRGSKNEKAESPPMATAQLASHLPEGMSLAGTDLMSWDLAYFLCESFHLIPTKPNAVSVISTLEIRFQEAKQLLKFLRGQVLALRSRPGSSAPAPC